MGPGGVPTDTTLTKSDLSHLSPFYQGVEKMPAHALVTILSEPGWGVDQIHEAAVEEFWRKMFHEAGNAHLLRITDSVESAFDLMGPQDLKEVEPLNVREEFGVKVVTMQSVQDNTEPDPITIFLGLFRNKPPVYEIDPPKNIEDYFEKAMKSRTHTVIAIRWIMDKSWWTFTDLDLHISHPKFKEKMAFDQMSTPFAKLFEDVRYGTDGANGEFGENWEVAVVKNEYLTELELWLDVFCAVGGPIEVNVAQIGGGVRKDAYYSVPMRFGDEALMVNEKDKSKAWFRVPLPLVPNEPGKINPPKEQDNNKVTAAAPITPSLRKVSSVASTLETVQSFLASLSKAAPIDAQVTTSPVPVPVITVASHSDTNKTAKEKSILVSNHKQQVKGERIQTTTIQPIAHTTGPAPWAWDYLCDPCAN